MAHTRTGSFPIGFRQGWTDWQKDVTNLIQFAKQNDFEAIDVGELPPEQIKTILNSGLRIGSVDLKRPWQALASADSVQRKDAVAAAARQIRPVAALGVKKFFAVVFPDDDSRPIRDSFKHAVEGYAALARDIAPTGAKIVIEGYPGSYPWYPALCCTPQSLREFFRETASDAIGINFDPSHLIRMGIDPVRFLHEFAPRVHHVHAKDTEIMAEKIYDFGTLQQSATADPIPFGGHFWRYTIPGHGNARWGELLRILHSAKYRGVVSIELEDRDFNGTENGEKQGLRAGCTYLMNV